MQPRLCLNLRPEWGELGRVRGLSADFLVGRGLARDVVDAMTMVTCELSENAIKYGDYDSPEARVDVTLDVGERAITVEVRNPVTAERQAEFARLDRTIQWIRGYQDPFQAYVERLKMVSAQSLDSKESGLGLVRISYEGQAVLDFYMDEQGLAVSAVFELTPSGRRLT